MFIAHKREEDNIVQPLQEHLYETAKLAGDFGEAFHNREYAYICGLLHDIGKYSKDFQNRIKHNGRKCDHSTAGARELYKRKPFGILGSYCIAGHHSGLQNIGSRFDVGGEGTLYGRLADEYEIPNYIAYMDEIPEVNSLSNVIPKVKPLNKGGFSIAFLIRMLYSALVDADYLNTEYFMRSGTVDRRNNYNFIHYNQLLDSYISQFQVKSVISHYRNVILQRCIQMSKSKPGLFSLTVPTGGGKTVSSMAFALKHLIENKMSRIIYVIPYTSIIEQNSMVFKRIFGDSNVLEHHSNFDFSDTEDPSTNKLRLSTENWDVPFVVTTNVQFFESLFSNKSSKCRKLHNIANSVIIFDEVQILPTEYLTLCINAIAELVYNCKSTVVLCSATQPAITKMFPDKIICQEICENTAELYHTFKRINVIKRGELSSKVLAKEMNAQHQCLSIVNTRKHAIKVFEHLSGEGRYHLSTLMCPAHRHEVIAEIKERLACNLPCTVVSTRLIEAGVDVDFPIVYRSIAGIDSIVQAAGRCNREGKMVAKDGAKVYGEVHVFEPEDEYSKRQPPSFKREIEVTNQVYSMYDDITSPEAIHTYFNILYNYLNNKGIDTKELYKHIENGYAGGRFEYDFQKVADGFKIINDNTYAVLVSYNAEAKELINKLEHSEYIGGILRSLQSYTVNIYETEYRALLGAGKLKQIREGVITLVSEEDYDDNTGLKIGTESGIGIYL